MVPNNSKSSKEIVELSKTNVSNFALFNSNWVMMDLKDWWRLLKRVRERCLILVETSAEVVIGVVGVGLG